MQPTAVQWTFVSALRQQTGRRTHFPPLLRAQDCGRVLECPPLEVLSRFVTIALQTGPGVSPFDNELGPVWASAVAVEAPAGSSRTRSLFRPRACRNPWQPASVVHASFPSAQAPACGLRRLSPSYKFPSSRKLLFRSKICRGPCRLEVPTSTRLSTEEQELQQGCANRVAKSFPCKII